MDHTYQGHHPPTKLAAMATSNQFSSDLIWYTDTGATDHITSDIGNLSIRSDYHGPSKVSVGNGASLCISHTGSNSISTPTTQFHLSNMLHVPDIFANLISVHRFASDNSCVFVFYTSGYVDSAGRVKMDSIIFQFVGFPTILIKSTMLHLSMSLFLLLYGI